MTLPVLCILQDLEESRFLTVINNTLVYYALTFSLMKKNEEQPGGKDSCTLMLMSSPNNGCLCLMNELSQNREMLLCHSQD